MCFYSNVGRFFIFTKNLNSTFQNELSSRSSCTHIGTNNFEPLVFPPKKNGFDIAFTTRNLGFCN